MLFRGEIEGALRHFNVWMTDDTIRAIIDRFEAIPSTIEGNREILLWLWGERQWYDENEQRYRRVRFIDFEHPGNNALHVTWEWKIKPPARKGNRADVMFVVNGIPVAIVEHKNPTDADAIERGIIQLRRYEKETPELVGAAQLFNVTHLLEYWYGVTWNVSHRFMARWKERPEDTYRFAVQSFFEPTDFLRTFLTADDRIEKVAAFVADHFGENVRPLGYKAFLVAVNREACARYKRALDKHLPSEWSAAVYTGNPDDIVHRPLVAELQLSPGREEDVRLMFKKAGENPQILIVTDKLLTGYDAKILYCMYLDKPMHDHVLLQAIARVNRPYVDANATRKRVGLVVDFVGVLGELKKALRFDSEDVSGVIEGLDLLRKDFLEKIEKAKSNYLTGEGDEYADEHLERIVYGRFLDPESSEEFFVTYKEMEAILIPLKERAEGILQDMERRRTDGLAAMDSLVDLVREKEAAAEELKNSGLTPRAFGVYWTLKNDEGLRAGGIDPMELARDTEALLERFPHAAVNSEERRRLRADLYKPLLALAEEERRTIVARVLVTLLGANVDAET